jgi:undecaprenyl-diphosphatase
MMDQMYYQLTRLGAGDRALFRRLALTESSHSRVRTIVVALTHLGGATVAILLAFLPLLAGMEWRALGQHAAATLVLSHLVVQLVKRTVGRPRPSLGTNVAALVAEPDRFSFPSGHAAAALAVALAYASAFPAVALPVLTLATIVGATRVALGLHYPGDVAAGQAIALATHLLLTRL